jgi:hypothetical protein
MRRESPYAASARLLASLLFAFTKTPLASRESVGSLLVFAECPVASLLPSSSNKSDGKMQEDQNARGPGRGAAASYPDD